MNSQKLQKGETTPWENLGGGVQRQILGFDKQMMMVKVKFEKGSIGSIHQHPHTQTTYCTSGKFQFTIDGEEFLVEPGDGLLIESNLLHGTICLEEGTLIDVFTPMREDFLV